jgi:hypothetical protein
MRSARHPGGRAAAADCRSTPTRAEAGMSAGKTTDGRIRPGPRGFGAGRIRRGGRHDACSFENVQNPTRQKQRGSVVVETALGSVLFFALLFGIFDFGHVFYCESTLKYAVSQAARFGTTGNTLPNEDNPGTQLSREDSILTVIRDLTGFQDLDPSDITVSAVTSGGAQVAGAGGPGDLVTVRAAYGVSLISPYLSRVFSDGVYRFEIVTTFKNEEFPTT